jgi:hypothetical protein
MKKLPPVARIVNLARSRYRAKAWQYAARAQVMRDLDQRTEFLRFSGMWLSLTEPIEDDLRGAHEWSANEPRDNIGTSFGRSPR